MKRIVILCDGTWSSSDMEHPTNVVRLGRAMAGTAFEEVTARDGTTDRIEREQVSIYIEGVGTGRRGLTAISRLTDRLLGGGLGWGLLDNVVEAYRHLVFLYEPHDEIYVFRFSRGAFTARSLVGLIRHSGMLSRAELHLLPVLVRRYADTSGLTPDQRQDRNLWWRMDHSPHTLVDPGDIDRLRAIRDAGGRFAEEAAGLVERLGELEPFAIDYMGIWDTVGSLGIPGKLLSAPFLNRRHQFHDTNLSTMVRSARHAVALDERRRQFRPTLWQNLDALNEDRADRPYREQWFPGDHGGVGGGGDIRDLSSAALLWLIEGAEAAGLAFRENLRERIAGEVNPLGHLHNSLRPRGGRAAALMRKYGKDRDGPHRLDDLHGIARTRWSHHSNEAGFRPYRPRSLQRIEVALERARDRDRDDG